MKSLLATKYLRIPRKKKVECHKNVLFHNNSLKNNLIIGKLFLGTEQNAYQHS